MLEFLQNRDIVDIVLSAEVIFCVVFTISLFIAVHALLGFLRQVGKLSVRLAQIEGDLNVLLASIPGKLDRINAMRQDIAPLRSEFEEIQRYYSKLQYMDRKWLEEQQEKERQEEEEKENQIQRQRLGLDRFL